MFGFVKSALRILNVSQSPTHITVGGLDTGRLFKDIYTLWGTTVIQKYMFSSVRPSELKMRHFFGLDFLYICTTILESPQCRSNRRQLRNLIEMLNERTWLGQTRRQIKSVTDESVVDKIVPFPLKSYQREFVQHYGLMVPAYRLKGYMLDAAPGSGKTVTCLVLAEAVHADKVILVVPKNSAERVWEDTIANIVLTNKPYWVSTSDREPSLKDHYYICHYESLERLLQFVNKNRTALKNIFVALDESHNFNRIEAQRTQMFVNLCQTPMVSGSVWSSGTPLQAIGVECIPFLKCIDPLFDAESEERFRKIYGRDAKRANDILRNRLGHLKYHVPKQGAVDIPVRVEEVKVDMPGSVEYTLDAISVRMKRFIDERQKYYKENFHIFKKHYEDGCGVYEKTIRSPEERRRYNQYRSAFDTIRAGYDPMVHKEEARLCNEFELRTIMPVLPANMKPQFKASRSVIKYLSLKIMGEALGSILGAARQKCHTDMIPHIGLDVLVDKGKKKTLVFSSFVETTNRAAEFLADKGYGVLVVHGETNKDLPRIVKQFYDDEKIDVLCATYQSLSTAVPLTAANQIIMVNQPFRSSIREQTIARAARLGQDEEVTVYDVLLDTGSAPNISTRSNDIMRWSEEQVAAILGVKNVDIGELSTEVEVLVDNSPNEKKTPAFLYHGSMYRQNELMPGFKRSGNLVKWDKIEDNTWLYTSSSRDEAIMLGISSAIEKNFLLSRYRYDEKSKVIEITLDEGSLTVEQIYKLPVYLYSIKADPEDGWIENYNPVNGLKGEFKTQRTIDKNILHVETIDVRGVLRNARIVIK